MKRRIVALLLTIALAVSLMPACFAASAEELQEATVSATSSVAYLTLFQVNVRSTASTSGTIRATLSKGTTVYYGHESGDWTYVTCGTVYGYIRSDLICKKNQCYYTTASSLALRSGAGTSYTVKAYISYNTFVQVLDTNSDYTWAYVRVREGTYENYYGWVSASYIAKYNGIS